MHYYCHDCAVINGTLHPVDPARLTDNQYKLEKYLKHTVPASLANYNTVFTSLPSSECYRNFVVAAVSSGHVQVDDHNRTNVVWVASRDTGISLKGGSFVGPTNAVKIVLHQDPTAVHAFPIRASELSSAACAMCGRAIPY